MGKYYDSSDLPAIRLFRPAFTPGVMVLALVNIAIFGITFLLLEDGGAYRRISSLCPNSHRMVFVELWRLIGFQFNHLNLLHIFLNLFVIIHGGPILEKKFGTVKFTLFYLLTAALAGFFYELLILAFDRSLSSGYPTLSGASGGVFAIIAGLIAINPRIRLNLYRFYIPFWWVVVFLVLENIFFIRSIQNGGNIIHLIALPIGWLFAKALCRRISQS